MEQFCKEIEALHSKAEQEREKLRKQWTKEFETRKRLSKITAKEVQGIKMAMHSVVTNDLSSHLAQAIQNHFMASPIAKEIE